MRILVTGANGYLGQGIVDKLIECGVDVVATDIKVNNINCKASRKECNLFDIENPYIYFEKPDVLLHLAWRDGFIHYADSHIEDLYKHYLFIKNMATEGVDRIAVMGSMHEVGFFEGAVDENTPCHPITNYGIAKNALRDLTKMICKQNNIDFQWLRGFYIVGNSKYGSSIFSKITAAVEEGWTEFPFTLGQNQYDFLDYPEFCKQVAYAVCQNEEQGIINICSGRPEKLSERVERFIKEEGYNISLKYGAFPDRPYDSKAIWGDNNKIEKILEKTNERLG